MIEMRTVRNRELMNFTWLLIGSITTAVAAVTPDMLTKILDESNYRIEIWHAFFFIQPVLLYACGEENCGLIRSLFQIETSTELHHIVQFYCIQFWPGRWRQVNHVCWVVLRIIAFISSRPHSPTHVDALSELKTAPLFFTGCEQQECGGHRMHMVLGHRCVSKTVCLK